MVLDYFLLKRLQAKASFLIKLAAPVATRVGNHFSSAVSIFPA